MLAGQQIPEFVKPVGYLSTVPHTHTHTHTHTCSGLGALGGYVTVHLKGIYFFYFLFIFIFHISHLVTYHRNGKCNIV